MGLIDIDNQRHLAESFCLKSLILLVAALILLVFSTFFWSKTTSQLTNIFGKGFKPSTSLDLFIEIMLNEDQLLLQPVDPTSCNRCLAAGMFSTCLCFVFHIIPYLTSMPPFHQSIQRKSQKPFKRTSNLVTSLICNNKTLEQKKDKNKKPCFSPHLAKCGVFSHLELSSLSRSARARPLSRSWTLPSWR